MEQLTDVVTPLTILGTVATAFVFLAQQTILKWREEKGRRLDLVREYTARQISEFYAPLTALTEQLNSTANVCDFATPATSMKDPEITNFIYDESFGPAHDSIMDIMGTKMHLAEGQTVPESFLAYFNHYWAQRLNRRLAQAGMNTRISDPGFPPDFYHDVRKGMKIAAARYEETISALHGRGQWFV